MSARRMPRFLTRLRASVPVLLDVAGFTALVVGTAVLFGAWAWLTAGVLLIVAGVRFQTPDRS